MTLSDIFRDLESSRVLFANNAGIHLLGSASPTRCVSSINHAPTSKHCHYHSSHIPSDYVQLPRDKPILPMPDYYRKKMKNSDKSSLAISGQSSVN